MSTYYRNVPWRPIYLAARAARSGSLFVLVKFIREPQTESPGTDDRVHLDVFGVFGVARERDPLCVADVDAVYLHGPRALGDAGRRVIGRKTRIAEIDGHALQRPAQWVGIGIGPALMRARDLPERLILVNRKFVANTNIALELGRYRKRRPFGPESIDDIDGLAGLRIHQRERLDHFAVVRRRRGGHRQTREYPREHGGLRPAHPIVRTIGDELQIAGYAGVQDSDLYVLPVFLVDRSVPLQSMVEPLGLPAELIVDQYVWPVGKRRRVQSVEPRDDGSRK